jgi:hypothetical protein
MSRSGHVYDSYVVGVYLAGAALEYCLKHWELVMHLSQACISQTYISHSHRRASLTDMHLPQACVSYRRASLTGMHLSQTYISHWHVSFIGMRLSQAYISHRHASLTSIYLKICLRGIKVSLVRLNSRRHASSSDATTLSSLHRVTSELMSQ